jgi:hypothetical protein
VDNDFEREVRETFDAFEPQAKGTSPGVLDVRRVVDQVGPWLKAVDTCLAVMNGRPFFTSSSATSVQPEV